MSDDYEPDYEYIAECRADERHDLRSRRLDAEFGRIEDWRKPKPTTKDKDPK